MAKWEKVGEVHRRKKDNNGWLWGVGIVVFIIILAAL